MLSIRTTRQAPRKLLVVTDMFITLIVVMVLWVYAYIQAHQLHTLNVYFLVYQLCINKVVF